ncbi:MAG: DUF4494 domain-containing protein [Muribaculaceae bacterium]
MENYFLTKVRFDKELDTGKIKTVTEQYLVNANSFTEAEARIIEQMTPFISGYFTVQDISRANISEVMFNANTDKYYKIKCNFIFIDNKTAIEKKQALYYLVQADNLDDSKKIFAERMKGTLADFEVEAVSETKIMDVFMCQTKD